MRGVLGSSCEQTLFVVGRSAPYMRWRIEESIEKLLLDSFVASFSVGRS